jgi:DNA anti-recombination protein RmuC
MDIKEAVMEALRALIIPELDSIKEKISVIESRLDGIDKRFGDMNQRFEDMRNDMSQRFEDMRNDMNQRFEDMRNDMNQRFEDMRKDMNQRSEDMRNDMSQRSEDLRKDMNKRFDDHFNFNMAQFKSVELKIHDIFAEIRELRRLYDRKPDIDQFMTLENRYIELLKEVTMLKQKVA